MFVRTYHYELSMQYVNIVDRKFKLFGQFNVEIIKYLVGK